MKNIEIPYAHERGARYRFFEMVPGLISWSILILPFVFSIIDPRITIVFIIAYMLLWFVKAMGLNVRALQGFKNIENHKKLPWRRMLEELEQQGLVERDHHVPAWHYDNIERIKAEPTPIQPSNILHAIFIAAYNESRDILEPTIQSVIESDYDMKKVILVLAYEERGGPGIKETAEDLVREYRSAFKDAVAIMHPDGLPGEVRGKGGNITYAGRDFQKYLETEGIDPLHVIVTTLDSDNRPHEKYLAALSYVYSVVPDPVTVSFQPVPMYTNNIWDAPAPMRVIATGNTFWNVVLSLRPHMIRNFSSHAQSMQTLIDTDYWSVRTIVEDGHQFWRTYFRYDGKHEVFPIYLPIYQDAVLSSTLLKTLKMQFIQLRRWAWGASDIAYVAEKGFFTANKVPKIDLLMKLGRLLEGHISWATAPLILAFSAFIPAFFNPKNYAAVQLPLIASRIQTIALTGIVVTLFLSLKLLPPKPKRYKSHRTLFMVFQWVMLPVTTICYNSFSALYSQTRLLFGRYLGEFDVTDKAVVKEDKSKVI
jgi:hypothetical protein